MVKTGYISFLTQTGGGYDGDANPIDPTTVKSEVIDCNLMVIKKEYKTFLDGQYKQASFSMYVDQCKINVLDPTININTIKTVELFDNNNNPLGEFQIHNMEYLNLSKRVKIVV